MTFNSTGAKKFADITGQLAKNQAPQNEFGIVLDGEVVSSPYVSLAITGGSAYISGHFTQQEAQSSPTCCRTARCHSPSRSSPSPP